MIFPWKFCLIEPPSNSPLNPHWVSIFAVELSHDPSQYGTSSHEKFHQKNPPRILMKSHWTMTSPSDPYWPQHLGGGSPRLQWHLSGGLAAAAGANAAGAAPETRRSMACLVVHLMIVMTAMLKHLFWNKMEIWMGFELALACAYKGIWSGV